MQAWRPGAWGLLILLACAGSLAACSAAARGGVAAQATEPGTVRTTAPELARLNDLLADLVERVKPALVRIRGGPAPAKEGGMALPQEPRAGGAGFLIDPGGTVVTTAHLLPAGDVVEVELSDGRRVTGRVLGRDTRADLAVVKLQGVSNLAALAFGDSDRVRVGEFVLALGHPFGLERAVSFGIVSRKGAPPAGGVPGFDAILTDASVNPGNSGGPLVNMAGEVVGVNSWAARNGSMGVAIPANLVKILLPQLVAKGRA